MCRTLGYILTSWSHHQTMESSVGWPLNSCGGINHPPLTLGRPRHSASLHEGPTVCLKLASKVPKVAGRTLLSCGQSLWWPWFPALWLRQRCAARDAGWMGGYSEPGAGPVSIIASKEQKDRVFPSVWCGGFHGGSCWDANA